MWLLQKNAILTKDNLAKRNWKGDKSCRFCNMDECINHLFFDCSLARYTWSLVAMVVIRLTAICWAVWQSRNGVCFEMKKIRSPTEIICLTSYLNYWAGLSKDMMKTNLEVGATALKEAALQHHPRQQDQADQVDPGTGLVLLC
jgi:hypothetical protein